MRGMPDVEGYLLGHGQFWIELKSTERPVRIETPVRFAVQDREAQVAWLTRRCGVGGRAWLLLQVGSGGQRALYLVSGEHAAEVYAGVNETRLQELSEFPDTRPSPLDVVHMAAKPLD